MSKWTRRFSKFFFVVALLATVQCSSGEDLAGPPTGSSRIPTPAVHSLLDLLTCSEQPYAVTRKVVGPDGGTILVGSHVLVIPSGALRSDIEITAEQVAGRVNSVRFSPEGLSFDKPANLTMSYANCSLTLIPKRIVYTDELLRILELVFSVDIRAAKRVTGFIDHFSRYAVAY